MKRSALRDLNDWIERKGRKPLVLRGARQVGKSTLVRQFAEQRNLRLFELNLEKHRLVSIQSDGIDFTGLVQEIEIICSQRLAPGGLLFLDEIHEQPKLLSVLRYFYEEMPWLPVIAAGSLREFALTEKQVSVPVGRIEYYFLGPLKFSEYLEARGEVILLDCLKRSPPVTEGAHARLVRLYKEYFFVGGMPEAVKTFVETKSFVEVRRVQRSILQTYQDDFSKYARHSQVDRVRRVFHFVPGHLGQKVKYSEIDREEKTRDLKTALQLLIQARVIIPVYHTNASGTPLSATADETVFKTYFLDVGLAACLQDVAWENLWTAEGKDFLTKGPLAEQFVAQHLFYQNDGFQSTELYYWLRDKKSKNAEVDFIISKAGAIFPVEVKSEEGGRLKSLLVFMSEKKSSARALKISSSPFKSELVEKGIAGTKGPVVFELITVPFYMIDFISDVL